MPPVSVSIKTENLELPPNAAHAEAHCGSITIAVESICIGQARRLAADFSLALEHGAVPHVQALMISEVHDAEERGMPLHCVLSFGV